MEEKLRTNTHMNPRCRKHIDRPYIDNQPTHSQLFTRVQVFTIAGRLPFIVCEMPSLYEPKLPARTLAISFAQCIVYTYTSASNLISAVAGGRHSIPQVLPQELALLPWHADAASRHLHGSFTSSINSRACYSALQGIFPRDCF
jgi:hypothetical protein